MRGAQKDKPNTLAVKPSVKKTKRVSVVVPIKKTPVKKSLPKKTLEKKVRRTTVTKKPPVTPKEEEVVFIPSPASLRMLEKVEVYRLWYKQKFPYVMEKATRVAGYTLVFLGASLASFSYLLDRNIINQPAAVICADGICNSVENPDLPIGSPLITFLNSLPAEFSVDTDIKVLSENTSNFELHLKAANSGDTITISPHESSTNNEHMFIIPARTLKPSAYTLSAEVNVNETAYIFEGPSFVVPEKENDEEVQNEQVFTMDEVETASLEQASTTEDVSTSTLMEPIEEQSTPSTDTPVSISLEEANNSKYLTIKTGDYLPTEVEIYTQLENFNKPIFLGLATYVQSEWVFSLSALDLPALKHYIFSSFKIDGATYQSKGVLYTPEIKSLSDNVLNPEFAILVQKVDLVLASSEISYLDRNKYFTDILNKEQFLTKTRSDEQFLPNNVVSLLNEYLRNQEDSINLLLRNYASAVQGEKEYVIKIATTQLQNHAQKLAGEISAELGDDTALTLLTTAIEQRYKSFMEFVSMTEQDVRSASGSLSSHDTDQDGLPDYDELSFYKTNPSLSDTDTDGVTDALESLMGYNPLGSEPESVSAILQNSKVIESKEGATISAISPVVVKSSKSTNEVVYALVQGKSLPNSFVFLTLNNFETMGIVRTNSQGSFSYTLEKELQNGKHEMAAGLIGNSGEVVVSSQLFEFTKKSQEFLASLTAANQPVLLNTSANGSRLSYYVTASIGVLAFGLILLLLAHGILPKKTTLKEKVAV